MYPQETVNLALRLHEQGLTDAAVAQACGVSVRTVRHWRWGTRRAPGTNRGRPLRTCDEMHPAVDPTGYAYLLGLYLGDGHIVSKRQQHHLSVYCCDGWPGLIDDAEAAMRTVMPRASVSRLQRPGCKEVKSYSMHWPCLFPQHGPGRKHTRPIVLEQWQNEIVRAEPWPLVRGLIHSDGCRNMNWTTKIVAGERKRYEYPRYLFANESTDIMGILTATLDQLGVEWKFARPNLLSVARRTSVALMDQHIGPKY
jgi:Homeodomain-like domain-containing protein